MRLSPFLASLTLTAMPTAAQDLGDRTAAPQSHLPAGGLAPGQDDLAEAIAAADTHPLGSLANPIRVGGPQGERAYLARLRCADGTRPQVGNRREGEVDAFGTVAAAFEIRCGTANARIYFDMYHEEHVENRAPAGFTVEPR